LNAEEKIVALEYDLFTEIRGKVAEQIGRIQQSARVLAVIDVLAAFAEARSSTITFARTWWPSAASIFSTAATPSSRSRQGRAVRPERHHIERGLRPGADHHRPEHGREIDLHPAGRADPAHVPDRFVRSRRRGPPAGGRPDLHPRGRLGQPGAGAIDFMVEMTEAANILAEATNDSLVILDEIGPRDLDFRRPRHRLGRGRVSSRHAGKGSAHAVRHALSRTDRPDAHQEAGEKLQRRGQGVARRDHLLRKIVPGGTSRSYGIQVARLAGLPEDVIRRAHEVLKNLETKEFDEVGRPVWRTRAIRPRASSTCSADCPAPLRPRSRPSTSTGSPRSKH